MRADHMDVDGLKSLLWALLGLRKPCRLKLGSAKPSSVYTIIGKCGKDTIALRHSVQSRDESAIVAFSNDDFSTSGRPIFEGLTGHASLCTNEVKEIYSVDNTNKIYRISNSQMVPIEADVPESALLYRARLLGSTLYVGCATRGSISRSLTKVDLDSGRFETVRLGGEEVQFLYSFDVQHHNESGSLRRIKIQNSNTEICSCDVGLPGASLEWVDAHSINAPRCDETALQHVELKMTDREMGDVQEKNSCLLAMPEYLARSKKLISMNARGYCRDISVLTMVKDTSLSKRQLVEVLHTAKTNREKNRAAKLLKKFDPQPHFEYDEEATKQNIRLKKSDRLLHSVLAVTCAFDVIEFGNVKRSQGSFTTSKGVKTVCPGCYNNLLSQAEVSQLRAHHQKLGLTPKVL
ncbi:hypothetical protein Pmar_PMAR017601 [Perkinsus marinus ATCC 50983]|uniref:Uncharacterized protein n=1 Tax=Perkinsus marinus (strain ATCC 50983 / TXsc) TaxID=423536 RepID=C5L3H2_PERM5|nr:hypothetical protein Pmar_PMAR017601 [Perkinsus marinus ATCC 50983]EER08551.1 hypothetical protein Pmar_PMAR017601 [Perkinsus marinus ATCC 50983]|eukprot:XP_002776735.1 hypothetical protein Pmar_PMAR017601 [Perkinsus marinus ATCC 50983]